jgi:hypothetical protein
LGSDDTGKKAIGPASKLYHQAEELLALHYAYVAYEKAHNAFKNFEDLLAYPGQWVQAVEKELRNCQINAQNAPEEKVKALLQNSAQLQAVFHDVRSAQVATADFLRSRKYLDAVQALETRLKGLDAASDTAVGLNSLLNHVRRLWRADRMAFIQARILKEEPALPALASAAMDVDELDRHHALDQDGDDHIAMQVRSRWHFREIKDVSGFALGECDEASITDLGKRPGVDWGHLLKHLDGLLDSRSGTDGVIQLQAYRVRLIALGNYGLSVERKESIERLTREIERLAAGSEAAGVYVALALRHLEQPDGYKKAHELVEQLRNVNQKTQQVAAGLEQLIEAYQLRQQQRLPDAVASLQSGVALLTSLLPEMQRALSREIDQTTSQWYLDLGNTTLQKLGPKADLIHRRNSCSLEEYFDILSGLNQVNSYLAGEPRIAQVAHILSQHSSSVGERFYQKISDLLENEAEDLTAKVNNAREYARFYEIAFTQNSPVQLDIGRDLWQGLSQMQDEFFAQKKIWDEAQANIVDLRSKLYSLFGVENGLWAWNTDPKEAPNKNLRMIREKMMETNQKLGGYQPREVRELEAFISEFQQTITAVTRDFGDLLTLVGEEKYEAALEKLEDVETVTESRETTLNRLAQPALRDKAVAIHLNPFFRLPNPYRLTVRNESGDWLETGNPEDVRGLDKISLHLENLLASRGFWEEWVQRAVTNVLQLRKARKDARDYLTRRHRLGEAVNLCHEVIDAPLDPEPRDNERRNAILLRLSDLKDQSDQLLRNAEPPRCLAALRFAKPPEEIAPPQNTAASTARLWKDLGSASRVKVISAWRKYLCQEIAISLQDLGPAMPRESLPDYLPESWSGIWNKEIESAFKSLDTLKEPSLENLISSQLARLKELVTLLTDYIRRHRLPKKDVDSRTLENLKNLVEEAMAIDDQAPLIIGAFETYNKSRLNKIR